MANSIDTVLQSLRDLAGGAAQFAKNREGRLDREAAYGAKKDQADAERKRLEAAGLEAEAIAKEYEADPENFDTKKLAKVSTNFRKVAAGDAGLNTMIDDFRSAAENVDKNARATAAATASAVKTGKKDARDEEAASRAARTELDTIAKAHGDEKETVALGKVRQAYERIDSAFSGEPNAAKDIAGITGFMKAQDEGSTVRETEFKTAAEAGSFWAANTSRDENGNLTTKNGIPLPRYIALAIEKYTPGSKGALLTSAQREDMLGVAEENYRRQLQQQIPIDTRYKKRLDDAKVSDYSKAISRFADDDLKALDAKKEERRRKKAAQAKSKELTLDPEAKDVPKMKEYGPTWLKSTYDKNLEAAAPAIAADEAAAGRKFTSGEVQKVILKSLEKRGYKFNPNLP